MITGGTIKLVDPTANDAKIYEDLVDMTVGQQVREVKVPKRYIGVFQKKKNGCVKRLIDHRCHLGSNRHRWG